MSKFDMNAFTDLSAKLNDPTRNRKLQFLLMQLIEEIGLDNVKARIEKDDALIKSEEFQQWLDDWELFYRSVY